MPLDNLEAFGGRPLLAARRLSVLDSWRGALADGAELPAGSLTLPVAILAAALFFLPGPEVPCADWNPAPEELVAPAAPDETEWLARDAI